MQKKVIFIVGPTAVGKTEVASFLSRKVKVEVISCDSMQVYKGMGLISAAPSKSVLKKLKHHLVGVLSPEKEYSVADFIIRAKKIIGSIHKKGKIPLIVGGSGLYMKALLDGIFEGPPANEKLRRYLYAQAKKYGSQYLHKKLERVDPQAASRIHHSDTKRIIRALEVFKLTQEPISRLQKRSRGLLEDYDVRIFGLNLGRQKLYERIDSRVDEMFRRGLLKEVKSLLKKKLSKTAGKIIGISEIKGYLDARYALEEALRLVKRNTRHYAKRQLTWFRKDKRIKWIDVEDKSPGQIAHIILNRLRKY
ncbi:MAG: tRNA (adenosine(37)-N6)-dimethylallyltransferase MiaA [Candidatus Omnitrophota bacterium]